MSMTKAELVDHVAATMDALQAGESVAMRGFGRFHLRHRPPRTGRNPRTGAMIPIPAKAVPTLTAGKALQDRVYPKAGAAGGAA
jgi:nucleoid DNA-binding protein